MAPGRLARQTLLGYAKDRTQQKTGLRMNLVAKANTILKGLPCLDTRIWAHKAQKKTEWEKFCSEWQVSAPQFTATDPKQCPLCIWKSKNQRSNVLKHLATDHPVSKLPYACTHPGCTEEFTTKNARTRHMEVAHGIGAARPFSCPHQGCTCGPFETLGVLNQHLKQNHRH